MARPMDAISSGSARLGILPMISEGGCSMSMSYNSVSEGVAAVAAEVRDVKEGKRDMT